MEDNELNGALAERFKELPKVIQDAITSADVEAHMRQLADTHKIHIDQWALLENEVMLTLLGLERMQDLAKNIAAHTQVEASVATALAEDISKTVFEPIRGELEKLLPEPEGSASAEGAIESRERPAAPVAAETPAAPIAPEAAPVAIPSAEPPKRAVIATTPPRSAPETKVERAPVSQNYAAAMPSHERTGIEGDPYREQVA